MYNMAYMGESPVQPEDRVDISIDAGKLISSGVGLQAVMNEV